MLRNPIPFFQMPTTQINIVLAEPRCMAGEFFNAKVLLDSSDPDTVIHSFTAEIKGIGRTGWVNIHTDKIFETEKVGGITDSVPNIRKISRRT